MTRSRYAAAVAAVVVALTGCAGQPQQPASTSGHQPAQSVDVGMTAVRLAMDHGLVGAVSQEPHLYSLSAAGYGNVDYVTYDNGDPATVLTDVRIDTYTTREARDAFVQFAMEQGQYTVAGDGHGAWWTVTQDQAGPDKVQEVAALLKK